MKTSPVTLVAVHAPSALATSKLSTRSSPTSALLNGAGSAFFDSKPIMSLNTKRSGTPGSTSVARSSSHARSLASTAMVRTV